MDNDASAPLEGFQQNLHEILNIILWLFVQAIAIGGFHDDIIRSIGILWVTNQGLMEVPNITGEQQLFADTVFLQPNFTLTLPAWCKAVYRYRHRCVLPFDFATLLQIPECGHYLAA